jgi:alpha-tubulin suppressor-like RCC1 family protein
MHILVAQNWQEVKAGSEFSLGIKEDGTLWGWGFNGSGQLGLVKEHLYELSPVQIGTDMDWKTISAGGFHGLALKNDGTLWGWGLNGNGQVRGTRDSMFFTPEQIGSDTDWFFVQACYGSSFAMKSNGTLWAWGYNGGGVLGFGGLLQQNEPAQVGTARWKTVSSGGIFTLGIQADNTLWYWGYHISYVDGHGYKTAIDTVPVQIGTDTNWLSVSAGMEHAIALKKDGSLWVYGDNTNKQLGYDTIYANDFFQIYPEKKWQFIEAGSIYTFAIDDQGLLYGWGCNIYGQLGLKADDYVTVPTPVHGHSVSQIAAAKGMVSKGRLYGLHTLMLSEDRNLMCVAGANYIGQLGTGTLSGNKTDHFICSSLNSIADNENGKENMIVFPNPSRDWFSVTNVQNANLTLYDLSGRKIGFQYGIDEQVIFHTENIPSGLYVLKIQKDNRTVTRKIQIIK